MTQQRLHFDKPWNPKGIIKGELKPVLNTPKGVLFDGDCLSILPHVASESIDTVFADPPFNIGKTYGKKVNDSLPDEEYVVFCRKWIKESVNNSKMVNQ